MSRLTTIEKILLAVTIVLLVSIFSRRSYVDPPVTESAPVKLSPARVLDLGMTLDEFKATYNLNAMSRNVPQLMLNNVETEDDAFANKFTAGFWLMGYVDKTTGNVKEIVIMEALDFLDSKPAALAFLIMVETLSPELTKAERAAILDEFSARPKYSSTIRGNVRYGTLLSDGGKILNLSAEAKDL